MGAGFSAYGVKNTKVYMRCPELDAPDMHVRTFSARHTPCGGAPVRPMLNWGPAFRLMHSPEILTSSHLLIFARAIVVTEYFGCWSDATCMGDVLRAPEVLTPGMLDQQGSV